MDRLRQVALVLFLGVLAIAACLAWFWRFLMAKKPADVTRSIKEKVAAVKATRAKVPPPPPPGAHNEEAAVCEAPPVVPETEAHCPQGAPWCCHVCGNMATGPVCTVDGAKGNA